LAPVAAAAPPGPYSDRPTRVVEVALIAMSLTASSEDPDAHLVVDGKVRLVEPTQQSVAERKLFWQSEAIPLERLIEADPARLRGALDEACDSIGRDAVRAARELWLGR
jgi:hypothetical protein